MCFITRDNATSGLAAAILGFECRPTSDNIVPNFIWLLNLENLIETFGISTLSAMEAEILVLPVYNRHLDFWVSVNVGQHSTLFHWSPRPRKPNRNFWNFNSICYGSWDITTSGLTAAFLFMSAMYVARYWDRFCWKFHQKSSKYLRE